MYIAYFPALQLLITQPRRSARNSLKVSFLMEKSTTHHQLF